MSEALFVCGFLRINWKFIFHRLFKVWQQRGSLSAIFNIDLDLDLNPMFASMEHMHMNRNIFNIDLDLDPNLMLHRSEHRFRVKIKVDIENSRKTTSLSSWVFSHVCQSITH